MAAFGDLSDGLASDAVTTRKRCPHGKFKWDCGTCSPCPHAQGKTKKECAQCSGCAHGKVKYNCGQCNPCPHGKLKRHCSPCKADKTREEKEIAKRAKTTPS